MGNQYGLCEISVKPMAARVVVARLTRFERVTAWFVARQITLIYQRVVPYFFGLNHPLYAILSTTYALILAGLNLHLKLEDFCDPELVPSGGCLFPL